MTVIYHRHVNSLCPQKLDPSFSVDLFSQNDAVWILATSALPPPKRKARKIMDGELCQFRKGFFDHLKPRAFVMGVVRIGIQQGTLIMATFMTDQLEQDMKRNEKVSEGAMTQMEADEQAEQWEKEEWGKRWQVFPKRFLTAFAKYHAVTLIMRSFEIIADSLYDKITLDKLTMDPFQAAMKLTRKEPGAPNSKIARTMFHTTFWANLISYMADYGLHQILLCYGYYSYYLRQKKKREEANGSVSPSDDKEEGAVIFSSLVHKSSQLLVARSVGLVCSAAGGAIGTIIRPGWGTLLCSNLGDGAASSIVDDGQSTAKK